MYYYYVLNVQKNNQQVSLHSEAYPEIGVLSTGATVDVALSHHYRPLVKHWQELINKGHRLKGFVQNPSCSTRTICMGLNPTETLKIMLHHAMLDKSITRPQLAHLLALTFVEWETAGHSMEKALFIKPKNAPTYQKVKRMLDLKHPTKLIEIEDALRCLDLQVHVAVVARQGNSNYQVTM